MVHPVFKMLFVPFLQFLLLFGSDTEFAAWGGGGVGGGGWGVGGGGWGGAKRGVPVPPPSPSGTWGTDL